MNTQIILASHGSMAEGTASAVEMIVGRRKNISAFGLDTWETPDVIREQVEKILDAHPEDAAVILCDIKGGSVHNRLFDLCLRDQVSLVTGMNLALALELAVSWEGTKEEVKQTLELARENLAYFDCCSIQNTEEKEDGELW